MSEQPLYPHVGFGQARLLQHGVSAVDATHFHPPTDVCETEDALVVTLEVAGLAGGAYEISLVEAERLLTISGQRHLPASENRVAYHQFEIRQGKFASQVYLPAALAGADRATATYEDGFLVIVLPKLKPRRVVVKKVETDR